MIIELNKKIEFEEYKSNIISIDIINSAFDVNPFAKYLLFINDNYIEGYLYYSDIYDRIEINQIEVETIHRNCGKGNKLMQYLINHISKSITLEVNINNLSAIHLYEKNGFEKVAVRKNYYNGEDGILMERKKDSE